MATILLDQVLFIIYFQEILNLIPTVVYTYNGASPEIKFLFLFLGHPYLIFLSLAQPFEAIIVKRGEMGISFSNVISSSLLFGGSSAESRPDLGLIVFVLFLLFFLI